MLSAQQVFMPQRYITSTTHHVPRLSPGIDASGGNIGRCGSSRVIYSNQRCFSWRSKCLYAPLHDSSPYRSAISYRTKAMCRPNKTLYRNYFWRKGHFLNQYTQSPEWRLLSSWNKSNGKDQEASRRAEEDRHYDWLGGWQKRHAQSLQQFEEFKRMIDEDPYAAIFGRRIYPRGEQKSQGPNSEGGQINGSRSSQRSSHSGNQNSKSKDAVEPAAQPNTTIDGSKLNNENAFKSDHHDDFVFDPITMRKISKRQETPPSQQTDHKKDFAAHAQTFGIPVKPYKAVQSTSRDKEPKRNVHPAVQKLGKEGQDWLAQEGFGTVSRSTRVTSLRIPLTSSKIESALDRHIRKESCVVPKDREGKADLIYRPEEKKTDDVDLLTASDIRASSGRVGKKIQDKTQEKQERREMLESDFNKRPEKLEKCLEDEIAAKKEQSEKVLIQELEDISRDVRKHDAAKNIHENEVRAQKAAMEAIETRDSEAPRSIADQPGTGVQHGEGDMSHNVHEFAGRDRWYKQKAPHASAEARSRLEQASKDKAFVHDIRGIYEDTYGIIDTEHRQQSVQRPTDNSEYPGDAYPGTLYEQPWSANVLNDHPELDSQGSPTFPPVSQAKDEPENQKFQVTSFIGKLFDEMRENQVLLHTNQAELRKIPTQDGPDSLFQKLKAHEQRIMQMLKTASTAIKDGDYGTRWPTEDTRLTQQQVAPTSNASVEQKIVSDQARPTTTAAYKILAYDPSSQKVTATKTTTLPGPLTEKTLSFSEALSGLENPAKFLPHFTALQHAKYEIAAGGPNFLVFKKAQQILPEQEPEETPAEASDQCPPRYANPIDGTTTPTGNFASPTGFVNYDPPLPLEETLDDPPPAPKSHAWKSKPRDKIHRQEDVFSGSSRRPWQEHRRNSKLKQRKSAERRKTLRRMLLVGVLTAGGCYAVGVASEFLRV